MLKYFMGLSRLKKKAILALIDFVMAPLVLWFAFFLRLEQVYPPHLERVWWLLYLTPFLVVPAYASQGLYNAVTRYINARYIFTVFKSISLATLLLAGVVLMSGTRGTPRSVFVIYGIASGLSIGAIRMLLRSLMARVNHLSRHKQNIGIYGAGDAGVQLARALLESRELQPVVFFDDKEELHGCKVMGLNVHSPSEISDLLEKYSLQEIVLCIPSASRGRRREILNRLTALPIHVKTLPGITELISDNVKIEDLREVDIEDVLGREAVEPIHHLFSTCISGKSVFVSGAGGSIGSELCRQILKQEPKRLILAELSEYNLYQIERELHKAAPDLEIIPLLGTVAHKERMCNILKRYQVNTIYHAAAYKHVPLVEFNVAEAVKNNIFGTWRLAQAAVEADVATFILISTDKAVRPTSVMGMTKRLAELVLQAMDTIASPTTFTMVRFGNVLGSSGSVIPLFREQIRNGGPITVTHQDVTRYFMTIPEAAQLVIQAGAMGKGGDVFLLDMGKPVKVLDMARKMIHLSGLTCRDAQHPDGDIEIKITGLRPGEKLYEELLIEDSSQATDHPRIMRANEKFIPWPLLQNVLDRLASAFDDPNDQLLAKTLKETIFESPDKFQAGNGQPKQKIPAKQSDPPVPNSGRSASAGNRPVQRTL